MAKYWKGIVGKRKTYEEALPDMLRGKVYTRPFEWLGVHLIDRDDDYIILTKDGEVLINPLSIEFTDGNDWSEVILTRAAKEILRKNKVKLMQKNN